MLEVLKGFKVLDLSHRLPGPLGAHCLSALGAQVTKLEDRDFGDPFKDGFFKEMDPSFSNWYKELNLYKEVQVHSFKEESFQETLHASIKEADIIILGLPEKLLKKFSLTEEEIRNNADFMEKAFIKMAGSRNKTGGMHDLNVLAKSGLLELFLSQEVQDNIIAPPFLPIGGISYGSFLASAALATLLKAKREKSAIIELFTLEEAVETILKPFFSQELKETGQRSFLHNGRYPCYNLYPLKDSGVLALAALEPKYWQRFCALLDLELSDLDRFHHEDDRVFCLIKDRLKSLSQTEAERLFHNKDCSVDIVAKENH